VTIGSANPGKGNGILLPYFLADAEWRCSKHGSQQSKTNVGIILHLEIKNKKGS
jgi:hypothetical protein